MKSGCLWGGAGCGGSLVGFILGVAIAMQDASVRHWDGDTQSWAMLFYGVGVAIGGAAVFLIAAALIRAVLTPPSGARREAGQVIVAVGIVLVLILMTGFALSWARSGPTITSPGLSNASSKVAAAPNLGPLSYPGMSVAVNGSGGCAGTSPDSLGTVRAFFDRNAAVTSTDCTQNDIACSSWTTRLASGQAVIITAHESTTNRLLNGDEDASSVSSTGPTVITYRFGH